MKLIDLLAELSAEKLQSIAAKQVQTDEQLSRAALCTTLEGTIKSFRFVQECAFNSQPPAFSLLDALLDAPGFALPSEGLRERVIAATSALSDLVGKGDILGRDDQLRLYRRVLYEARRNDLKIDSSESAILGALRKELGI